MLNGLMERVGDAGLQALDRGSSRRGFLAKSVAAAALALGIKTQDAKAGVSTWYCFSRNGCTIRSARSFDPSNVVGSLPYKVSRRFEDGRSGAYYIDCTGSHGYYNDRYWRRIDGTGYYIHSNLLVSFLPASDEYC